jgi:hypothetical protein
MAPLLLPVAGKGGGDDIEFVIDPNVEELEDGTGVTESSLGNVGWCIFAECSINTSSLVGIMLEGFCKRIASAEGCDSGCAEGNNRGGHDSRGVFVLVERKVFKVKSCS